MAEGIEQGRAVARVDSIAVGRAQDGRGGAQAFAIGVQAGGAAGQVLGSDMDEHVGEGKSPGASARKVIPRVAQSATDHTAVSSGTRPSAVSGAEDAATR